MPAFAIAGIKQDNLIGTADVGTICVRNPTVSKTTNGMGKSTSGGFILKRSGRKTPNVKH
jgi:hypothetical protein